MAEDLKIVITANTAAIETATTELKKLETGFNTLSNTLKKEERSWTEYASVVTAVATSFKAVHLAITNYIIAPLSRAVNGFMALGDQISKTSQRIGMSVEMLGGLKFAAEQCGANFEILTEGIKAFQNQLGAAQMGDSNAISKLGKVGLNAEDFVGLSNEDQLMKLANHIKSIGDKAEQTRVAMELFGKAGFKLLPFFQEGSAGIKKLIEEGKDIGAVLGEDAVNGAVEMTDAMNRMKTSASNVGNVLLSALAPSIIYVLDEITQLSKWVSKLVSDHPVLITSIGSGIAAFSMLHLGISSIIQAMPALIAGFAALKTAVITNPILLGVTAGIGVFIGAIMAVNMYLEQTEKKLFAISDAAQKAEKEFDATADADKKLMDRLQELADIEDPLNNEEVKEAQTLVAVLESRYGELGVTIDATSGKIEGMTTAQKKFNEELKKQKIEAVEKTIAELKANVAAKKKKVDSAVTDQKKWGIFGYKAAGRALFGTEQSDAKIADADAELAEQEQKLREKEIELRQLKGIPSKTGKGKQVRLSEMTQQNRENRAKTDAAKAANDEEYKNRNEQLQKDLGEARDSKKDPYTIRLEKWEKDFREKIANVKKMQDMALENDSLDQYYELIRQEAEIREHAKTEKAKILAEKKAKEDEKKAKEEDEQKALNPELKAHFDTEEIEEKKQAVEDAKQKEADAILAGDLEAARKAREEADAANIELAKAVATASGAKRTEAAQNVADAKAEYDQAKKEGANNKTLNELYEKYEKALAQKEQADREYYEAVGTVQAGLKTPEEKVQDAVQTTLSTSGTFSAYGMDAAVQVNVTQEILVTLQKIYGVTDKMEKNQGNESVYTEKK